MPANSGVTLSGNGLGSLRKCIRNRRLNLSNLVQFLFQYPTFIPFLSQSSYLSTHSPQRQWKQFSSPILDNLLNPPFFQYIFLVL